MMHEDSNSSVNCSGLRTSSWPGLIVAEFIVFSHLTGTPDPDTTRSRDSHNLPPVQLYSNEPRLSASFKQPCVCSCRWVTLWMLLGICFTYRNSPQVSLVCFVHATFSNRSLTSPLTFFFFFYNLVSLKSLECLGLLEQFLKRSRFRRWTSSDSVIGVFYYYTFRMSLPRRDVHPVMGLKQTKGPFCSKNVQILRHLHCGSVTWVHMLGL